MRNENRLIGYFRGLRYFRPKLPYRLIDVWAFCPKSNLLMHKFQVNYKRDPIRVNSSKIPDFLEAAEVGA